jgi:hypothetical protein
MFSNSTIQIRQRVLALPSRSDAIAQLHAGGYKSDANYLPGALLANSEQLEPTQPE